MALLLASGCGGKGGLWATDDGPVRMAMTATVTDGETTFSVEGEGEGFTSWSVTDPDAIYQWQFRTQDGAGEVGIVLTTAGVQSLGEGRHRWLTSYYDEVGADEQVAALDLLKTDSAVGHGRITYLHAFFHHIQWNGVVSQTPVAVRLDLDSVSKSDASGRMSAMTKDWTIEEASFELTGLKPLPKRLEPEPPYCGDTGC